MIGLLVEKYPGTLRHHCIVGDGIVNNNEYVNTWLPLHHYLERESNVDIDTVKVLVEEHTLKH